MTSMDSFLLRVPINVSFAGMSGNTFKMAQCGWTLNVHKERDHARDALLVRISGKNDILSLRLISRTLVIDRIPHYGKAGSDIVFMESVSRIPFEVEIEHVARNFVITQHSMTMISRDWNGLIEIKNPEKPLSFDNFFSFPEKSGLVIHESKLWTIQQHLDAIMKEQQPLQDSILRDSLDGKVQSKDILKLIAI